MTTALTPPMSMTATPERAQPTSRDRRSSSMVTRGRIAQGTSSPGRAAADVEPMTIVNVGHSTNATPASSREPFEPIRSAVVSLVMPQKPAAISDDSHSRSITQIGSRRAWPIRKNGAIGIA